MSMDEKKVKGTGYAQGEHGKGRIFRRGKTWWVQYYVNGQQVRESSKSRKKSVAEKLLMRRLVAIEDGTATVPHRQITYEEMRQRLVTDRTKKQNAGKPEDGLKPLDAAFGGLKASVITRDAIDEFALAQRGLGKANDTINGYLRALRRMFRLSAADVKNPPDVNASMLKASKARQGFIDREQYLRLLAMLPDYVRPIYTFGYFTGMRLGELKNLTWARVDRQGETIRLESEDTKNAEPRAIPYGKVPELKQLMDELWKSTTDASGLVFTRKKGKRLGSFRKAWIRACIKASIATKSGVSRMLWECPTCHDQTEVEKQPWPPELPKAEPPRCAKCDRVLRWTYCGLIFHDLRRAGVRNLVRAGVPQSVAMRISGHKTTAVFQRYNITDEKDIANAMERVAQFHTNAPGEQTAESRPN
jgi:integrase